MRYLDYLAESAAFLCRIDMNTLVNKYRQIYAQYYRVIAVVLCLYGAVLLAVAVFFPQHVVSVIVFGITLILVVQSITTFYLMTYAWNRPSREMEYRSPENFSKPMFSFTAIIPARHEKEVIQKTIESVAKIAYPESLKEIIVVCTPDDTETISEVKKCIKNNSRSRIKLITYNTEPINKPHSLNFGFSHCQSDIVVVFDAEDEPHKDIYSVVNTVFCQQKVDVVQSGVQLMDVYSRWYSLFNVLEYYFWFKSFLQFMSQLGLIPLGGNTVFFKTECLRSIGGWDAGSLTEDADIGIRLSALGKKIRVVYDETHATHEETPETIGSFIRQRTRWNQGFLQVLQKGEWKKLPHIRQQILAIALLGWPIVQAILLVYLPIAFYFMATQKIILLVALFSAVPLYLLLLQLVVMAVGYLLFCRNFSVPVKILSFIQLVVGFIPYQIILGLSSFRAIGRFLRGNVSWEKTMHANLHRIDTRSSKTSFHFGNAS